MKLRFLPYISAFLLTMSVSALSSGKELNSIRMFKHLSKNNGLMCNRITAIEEDKYGRVWVGTALGLNYYDSYRITDESLFSGVSITALKNTGDCMIICTSNFSMLYEYNTGRFIPLEYCGDDISNVQSVISTEKDGYVLNTKEEIFVLKDSTIKVYDRKYQYLEADKYGHFWGASRDTVYRLGSSFNIERKYVLGMSGHNIPVNISALYSDSKGRLWAGTLNDGLFWMNEHLDRFVHEDFQTRYVSSEIKNITCLNEDRRGKLWIGHNDGISVYDYINDSFKSFICKNDNNTVFHTVTSLHMSEKSKNMFAGTYFSGIFYIEDIEDEIKYNVIADKKNTVTANGMALDPDGNICISTNISGVFVFDSTMRQTRHYNSLNSIIDDNIVSICRSPYDNTIWAGSIGNGLYNIDINTGKAFHYAGSGKKGTISGSRIHQMLYCCDTMYIATDKGIDIYDYATGRFSNIIYSDIEVSDIVCTDSVLYFIDPFKVLAYYRKGRYVREIPIYGIDGSSSFQCGCAGYDGTILLGTNHGELYRIQNDTIRRHPSFKKINENISNMLKDSDGYLWISGGNRIHILDTAMCSRSYDLSDLLGINEFNIRSKLYDSEKKRIIFGTTNGIAAFPQNLKWKDHESHPAIFVSGLEVNNSPTMGVDGTNTLEKSVQETEGLAFKYYQNNLTFRVSVIDYDFYAPCHDQCLYRLDNYEKNWHKLDISGEISYLNLPAGRYRLEIKIPGSMDSGDCKAYHAVDIKIKPHFLASIPMIILYFIMLIAAVTAVYLFDRRQQKIKLALRLAENEKKEKDNLEKMKMDMFSGIAYEFITPVSIISSLHDSARTSADTMEESGNEDIFRKSVNRLSYLVEQMMTLKSIDSMDIAKREENYDLVAFSERIYRTFAPVFDSMEIAHEFHVEADNIPVYFDAELMEILVSNIIGKVLKEIRHGSTLDIRVYKEGGLSNIKLEFDCPEHRDNMIDSGHPEIGSSLIKSLVKFLDVKISCCGSGEGMASCVIAIADYNGDKIQKDLPDTASSLTTQIIDNTLSFDNILPSESANVSKIERYKVMVIDNDHDYCKFLEQQLKDQFNIYSSSGKDAAAIISTHNIDAIICDMHMKDIDPFNLCHNVKNSDNLKHIFMIMTYFEMTDQMKIRALQSGADAIVHKPVDIFELKLRLNNMFLNKNSWKQYYSDKAVSAPEPLPMNSSDEIFIRKITEYINSNLSDPDLSVTSLAEAVHVSRTQLYLTLKRISGRTPTEFIYDSKMHYAKQWLEGTGLSINEISDRLGFCNANYFSRQFKNHFGISPRIYRKGFELNDK